MRKKLSAYTGLTRLSTQSLAKTAAAHFASLGSYTPSDVLAWAWNVGRYALKRRCPFPTWTEVAWDCESMHGRFGAPDLFSMSVAGDWGTGTQEAHAVAEQIWAFKPHYTVHLGDVYYSGTQREIEENFLGTSGNAYTPVAWPRGSTESFVLPGNHELYSGGDAFYKTLLPLFGQQASYFCLENKYWRILGLDTGYNSTGIDVGFLRPSCAFPKPVMTWLKTLNLNADNRKLLVLTHHGPWSSFELAYPAPAKQLAAVIDRPFLWLWGHEHRLAIYDRITQYGVTVDGRCIGSWRHAHHHQETKRHQVLVHGHASVSQSRRPRCGIQRLCQSHVYGPSTHD